MAERKIERRVTPAPGGDGEPGPAPPTEREGLVRDVLLLDGSTLRLRAPAPDDLDDLRAFFDGLSPESRYLRFHGFGRTDLAARSLIEATGSERVGLIGRQGGRVVATAQYDVLREPGVAEVAFAVADDFRRRGAATRLLEQLAQVAAERGVRRFVAEVLTSNRPMLSVFGHAGFEVQREGAFGEVTVSLDITPSEAVREVIDARDHAASVASLRAILSPASVAVVGASDPVGRAALENIRAGGFCGKVVAADSLLDLERAPELAILAGPSDALVNAASEAALKGVKALLVLSPDFGEEQADKLLEIVRAGGLRVVGPSSLGVVNTAPGVRLHAVSAATSVAGGRLAVCSQSGAIGVGLLGQAAARRLGVSAYTSLGDRIDVSTNDVLELWEEDSRVAAVMLYVETFGHPEHFARIAARVSRRKPILAVKGRRAAQQLSVQAETHTAAALRGDAVVDALFQQAGVLRFRSGEELFNAAAFFESQPLPLGRQVAIVTNSAGVATLAADACATRELVVSERSGGGANPLVLAFGAGAEEYAAAVTAGLDDPGVDALMVSYVDRSDGDPAGVLEAVAGAGDRARKPIVASIVGSDGGAPVDPHGRVPNFVFPEACAGVLGRAVERRQWLSRPLGERPQLDGLDAETARAHADRCLEDGREWLTWPEAEGLLATHGIVSEPASWCISVEEAIASATAVGGPVALKAACHAPEVPADFDAVLLGLEGDEAIRAGWLELRRRTELDGREWIGAVVQRLVEPGADVLVGALSDPDLGSVMAVGLGGRQAGLAGGVSFRLRPRTDVEADELIDAADGVVARVEGFRGRQRLDRQALRTLLLRFSALLATCSELVEADLNPVRLMPDRCVVLEMRMRVERRPRPQRIKTW